MFPAAILLLALLVGYWLWYTSRRYKARSNLSLGVGAGFLFFLVALIVTYPLVFLGFDVGFANVLLEEVIKFCAVALVYDRSRAIFVTTAFGLSELLVVKLLLMFALGTLGSVSAIENAWALTTSVSLAALLMHVSTGMTYDKWGLRFGFMGALPIHLSYNFFALTIEGSKSNLPGFLLLAYSAAVAALIYALPQFSKTRK